MRNGYYSLSLRVTHDGDVIEVTCYDTKGEDFDIFVSTPGGMSVEPQIDHYEAAHRRLSEVL